jgi:hypothetical protein
MKSDRRRAIIWPSLKPVPDGYPRKHADKAAAPIDKPPWPRPVTARHEPRQGLQKEEQSHD